MISAFPRSLLDSMRHQTMQDFRARFAPAAPISLCLGTSLAPITEKTQGRVLLSEVFLPTNGLSECHLNASNMGCSRTKLMAITHEHLHLQGPSFSPRGAAAVLEDVQRRTGTVGFCLCPGLYMCRWECERGPTEEFRMPEDLSRTIISSYLDTLCCGCCTCCS